MGVGGVDRDPLGTVVGSDFTPGTSKWVLCAPSCAASGEELGITDIDVLRDVCCDVCRDVCREPTGVILKKSDPLELLYARVRLGALVFLWAHLGPGTLLSIRFKT